MLNSCGLPAVPVDEQCGVDLLLIQVAQYAACPLIPSMMAFKSLVAAVLWEDFLPGDLISVL
jgi:hypothetical protein